MGPITDVYLILTPETVFMVNVAEDMALQAFAVPEMECRRRSSAPDTLLVHLLNKKDDKKPEVRKCYKNHQHRAANRSVFSHHGHPRVTVVHQSDLALFALGLSSSQFCSRSLFPLLSILPLCRSSQIITCKVNEGESNTPCPSTLEVTYSSG
jgi:hypothetical protein